MKCKLIAIFMAIVMLTTMAPAAFAADDTSVAVVQSEYNKMSSETDCLPQTVNNYLSKNNAIKTSSNSVMDETAFRQAVANGGQVNLTGNVTLTGSTVTIDKAVTINGSDGNNGQYSITYNGSEQNAFRITTDNAVSFENVVINATGNGKRAISLYTDAPHFSFTKGIINANERGIWMESGANVQPNVGATITISDSQIINSRIPSGQSFDTWTTSGSAYRGISLWNLKAAEVSILNTDVLGFSYAFYLGGDPANATVNGDTRTLIDSENTSVIIDNCSLKGWSAIYNWAARASYYIFDTDLLGVNNVSGAGYNSFATIVIESGIYDNVPATSATNSDPFATTLNIYGGTIKNYATQDALEANNAEWLISVDRDGITQFNFDVGSNGEAVVIKDQAGCANGVFYNDDMNYNDMLTFLTYKVEGTNNCELIPYDPATIMSWGIVNRID